MLNVIHPDYKQQLLLGELKSDSVIKTKCPNCGNYEYHSLHNVFTISKQDFRTGYAPLCSQCTTQLTTSKYEQELEEFIKVICSSEIIRNTREIIPPLELDIYIPEKKIAIEFNGDYWHNEDHKPKDYHVDKYKCCKDNDILLISIFESEWNSNKDAIKEYIKDTFSHISNKLSYTKDGFMNNNYPDINSYSTLSNNILEYYYTFGSNKVYTCGYTKLE